MFVHEATQSLCFFAPDPFAIRALLPHSRILPYADYNIAVKHSFDNIRVLRNLGFDPPMPRDYDFPGKFKPLAHQLEMFDHYLTHFRCFNLSEPGTMKTKPALWAADKLMLDGVIQRAAIISTLSTMQAVWQQEIFDTVYHRTWAEAHGSAEKRKAAMARDVDFFIFNHHGVVSSEVWKGVHDRKDIGLVIVDEGQTFRKPGTDMYKALASMIRKDQRVWWLTGGPCPNQPSDVWSQCRIVNPSAVPQFKGAFKRQVEVEMTGKRRGKDGNLVEFKHWISKSGAMDRVYEVMQPAIRFEKKDCIELPPLTTINFQAKMSVEQTQAFKRMKNDMQAEFAKGVEITAVNAVDRIIKLRQILCGCIKNPETDEYITIDHKPRFNVLMEILEGARAKCIIVVPFKGIIRDLEKELRRAGRSVAVINGDVPLAARKKIFTAFKTEDEPHDLLCHPKVMAHGLNLTEADLVACYAPISGNEDWSQVIERFNRAGQKNKMTIARIATHPMEWDIYKALDADGFTQQTIMSLYRKVING
jgi:hypothetical protein